MKLIEKIGKAGFAVSISESGKLIVAGGKLTEVQAQFVAGNKAALIREVIFRDLATLHGRTADELAAGQVEAWGVLGANVGRLPYCQTAADELRAVLEEIAAAWASDVGESADAVDVAREVAHTACAV